MTVTPLRLAAALCALAAPALAHQAPAGWTYDGGCCNAAQQHGDGRVTGDCAPIPETAVEEVRGGYIVRLAPGDHARISKPREFRFEWSDTRSGGLSRILPSPDGQWHACVTDHARYCLYFVPGGV